jgi:hypothetical protein
MLQHIAYSSQMGRTAIAGSVGVLPVSAYYDSYLSIRNCCVYCLLIAYLLYCVCVAAEAVWTHVYTRGFAAAAAVQCHGIDMHPWFGL